jgi:hypothetical protein
MHSVFIDSQYLLEISQKLMDGHVSYGWGSKAPSLSCDTSKIHRLDCSGFVRYLLYQASDSQLLLPDGSYIQHDWCKHSGLARVDYSSASANDGWLRIAFIPPAKHHAGHVWLILNGLTLESHGGKGPDRRAWNSKVLKTGVRDCYKLAQTYSLTIGPVVIQSAG